MKTIQHIRTTSDRLSTHEELHQVLALVSEGGPDLTSEALSEPEEEKALRDAVADLWREAAAAEPDGETGCEKTDEAGLQGEMYRWAEMLTGKIERIN